MEINEAYKHQLMFNNSIKYTMLEAYQDSRWPACINNITAFYLWAPFKALKDTLQSIIKNKQHRRSNSNSRLKK